MVGWSGTMTGMRTVEDHAAQVAALIAATGSERRRLTEAVGHVLAADLIAPIDLPPFRNSAMDGYAARAADLAGFPLELPVSQDIPAGFGEITPLVAGTVARIMTGAPLPPGTDTIVPVERTDGGTARVLMQSAPPPGVHVRDRGADIAMGTPVLHRGQVVAAPQVGVAAALGVTELEIRSPLKVLVLSTGSELVEPGQPLGPGQIYESNAAMLAVAVTEAGGVPTIARFVADDVAEFWRALEIAATEIDLIVTSGGVSAGAFEVVKDALDGHGVDFVKVAMQPGMPQGCGTIEVAGRSVPIVTLPGNPVSSFVSFEVFLRPAIRAAIGHPQVRRPVTDQRLGADLTSPAGKRQFRRGVLDDAAGTVAPWGGPGSHLLSWLAGADAMIVIAEDQESLPAGTVVPVWSLH